MREHVLYFNSPSAFKDPYDCGVPPSILKMKDADFHKKIPGVFDGVSSRFSAILKEPEVRQTFAKWREKVGVSCFSDSPKNLLMWSQYGGGGGGFCLKYDTQKMFDWERANAPLLFQVEYRETWPDNDIFQLWNNGEIHPFVPLAKYKYKAWEHERELRLFVEEKGKVPYNPEALTGVYLGPNINHSDEERIRSIVEQNYPHIDINVDIRHGVLSTRDYSVDFSNLEDIYGKLEDFIDV